LGPGIFARARGLRYRRYRGTLIRERNNNPALRRRVDWVWRKRKVESMLSMVGVGVTR
jgi:hypothetical protein